MATFSETQEERNRLAEIKGRHIEVEDKSTPIQKWSVGEKIGAIVLSGLAIGAGTYGARKSGVNAHNQQVEWQQHEGSNIQKANEANDPEYLKAKARYEAEQAQQPEIQIGDAVNYDPATGTSFPPENPNQP